MTVESVGQELLGARREVAPIEAFSLRGKPFDLDFGYQVQSWLLEKDLEQGESLSGYKMGLTSLAKQRDVGVTEPIRGYLLASMAMKSGETLSTEKRIHPRVEPEIAVTLKRALRGQVDLPTVVDALETLSPACEILDSRFANFKFKLPDVVADNTSASGYLVGQSNWLDKWQEVPLFGVSIQVNGTTVQSGAPAAVLGNPLNAVVDLVKALDRQGKALEPGMVVLTGGITASVSLKSGDEVRIRWPGETLQFSVK